MKITSLLLVAGCTALAHHAVQAQLIQNGGFETADFTNWSTAGTVQIQTGSAGSNYVHSGSFGVTLGSGILSQSFATTPGQIYRVEFFMNAIEGGDVGLLDIRWGNSDIPANLDLGTVTLLHSFDNPDPIPDPGWHKYSYDLLALGTTGTLEFEFQTQAVTYPDNAALDGVSVSSLPDFASLPPLMGVPIGNPSPTLPFEAPYVLSSSITPVPEPSTYGLLAAAGLAGLVLARRFRSSPRKLQAAAG